MKHNEMSVSGGQPSDNNELNVVVDIENVMDYIILYLFKKKYVVMAIESVMESI